MENEAIQDNQYVQSNEQNNNADEGLQNEQPTIENQEGQQPDTRTFTQDELNKYIAEERYRNQQKHQRELEQYQAILQQQVQQYQQNYGDNQAQQPQQQPDEFANKFVNFMQAWEDKKKEEQLAHQARNDYLSTAEKYSQDFHTVMDSAKNIQINPEAYKSLCLQGKAAEFLYTAIKHHRAEFERITQLPPELHALALGELKGRITAGNPPKLSSAPQPITHEPDSRGNVTSSDGDVDSRLAQAYRERFQR